MKIAFIGQKGIPVRSGGVERRVQELATRMTELGHEVFVYARNNYSQGMPSEYKGVKIIYLPYIRTKNLSAITHTFLATLHAIFGRYDIVHFQAPGPSTLCWIIKLFSPRTGLVATFNSRDEKHQKWGRLAQTYLRFGEYIINKVPDKTIAVSELLKEYSKAKFNNEPVVIHNGSAVNLVGNGYEIEKFDLKKNRYILSVSRLIRHKGIHYLIEAFKDAQKDKDIPGDFKLVIVGDGAYTDEYVSYLKDISAENKNIIFLGSQMGENLSQLFTNASVFVQPSEAEGLSNALLEAMGYGIAPIVSDIPENKNVVGENGFIFENKNISHLRKMIVLALSDLETTKKIGLLAKENIEKNYSWDENVSKTLKLYEDLIGEKKKKIIFGFQGKTLS